MIYHDKIFTAEECKEIRELMNISFIGKRADAEKVQESTKVFYRNNLTLEWDISHLEETEWIFYRIVDWCKQQVPLIQRPNKELYVLEYLKGHHLKRHNDVWDNYSKRIWTFVAQLSEPEDYKGSKTIVYQDNKSNVLLKPEIGSCILFESKLDHEATIVTEGTRHSLVMCFEDEDVKKSIL